MKEDRIFIGTSGWTYDDWSGKFYPSEVKGADRLSFYARRFNTVEVNATFYRIPFQSMVNGWNKRLDSRFHLVVKGSRTVTHFKKLNDYDTALEAFFDRVLQLRCLRVILWQLPPSFHKDLETLERFLSILPSSVRHAVEFRHKSWWSDDAVELLSRHNAAFAAVSHASLPDDILPSTDFLYIRFHGIGKKLYQYDYSREELEKWAARLKNLLPDRTLYAFFNNDYNAYAPQNAETLRELLISMKI